ncbi:MAG: 3-phosphoshikimate 1-carboxyvinyltransferase [Succinatimonas hippei]|nr:3-phosphoshikimate 1-carboxyvinyltransferase [Succinatimonas hippei]
MNSIRIEKIKSVSGRVTLPGSKSLSNRALLCASLSDGRTTLLNLLRSDDTARMIEALKALGVTINDRGTTCQVDGIGHGFDTGLNRIRLDLGNAGTAMRPLCAALAFSNGNYELTGSKRMFERPIGPLCEALRSVGAHVDYLNNPGFPPLVIRGSKPKSHEISVDGSLSSQFLTALLLSSPIAGGLKIRVRGELISKPYVDLSIRLMERFGVEVQRRGYSEFTISDDARYKSPGSFLIEGDATAATYFAAAAAIAGKVEIYGLSDNSVQGDTAFLNVLERMGANVTRLEHSVIVERQGRLKGIDVDMNAMPDAAMTLVPLALYTDGPVTIRNIASWRVKETDRISAMETEMRKLGVKVESGADYISIDASVRNQDVPSFDTYDDHRMAMCMSLCAFDRDIVINDPQCVAKTFPGYFKELQAVTQR